MLNFSKTSDRRKEILAGLERNLAEDRLHHAYIFSGPVGVGKLETAQEFAANLLSQGGLLVGDRRATLERLGRGNEPDYVWIEAQDAVIKVAAVRDLPKTLSYAPLEANWRVLVIQDAQCMNLMAANALLKILEEPPPHTVFILITPDSSLLLRTIVSRAQVVRFFPLSETMLKEKLAKEFSTNLELEHAVTWAEGSYQRAQEFLENDDLRDLRKECRNILLELWESCPRITSAALTFLEKLKEEKEINYALDTWLSLCRDMEKP